MANNDLVQYCTTSVNFYCKNAVVFVILTQLYYLFLLAVSWHGADDSKINANIDAVIQLGKWDVTSAQVT